MKRKMISLLLGAVLFTSAVWPDQPALAEQSYGTEQIYDTETPWEAEAEEDENMSPGEVADAEAYADAGELPESARSNAEQVYPDMENTPDLMFPAENLAEGEDLDAYWNAENPWNPEDAWNPEESWNQEEVWDPAEWENPDGIWNEDDSEVGLGFIVLDTENAGEVEAEDPESEALLEEIESGEIIALAAMDPGTPDENMPMMLAAAPVYRMEVFDYLDLDEIDRKVTYRELIYTDYQGKERRTPVFCMEAPYKGMDSQVLKNEAIKSLSKSLVQKILYFGYGGPGDICDSFDPSCSHINWSKWDNRYMFTHMALSKHYSGLYGRSPEEQYEHVGVNRFVDKISTLTIPARDGMTFSSNDGYGTQVTAKNLVSNLRIWPKGKAEYAWVDTTMAGFEDGYQISYNIVVRDSAKAGNTISITRTADSPWQLGYWTSKAEMDERGAENPRVLKVGQTVTLKDGYYLRIIFPKQMKTDYTFTCKMSLAPVSFLLIDGEIQTNTSRSQDFGVAVYQGESGVATLKMHPAPSGNLTVTKKDFKDQKPVKGAKYGLYAAEDIYQMSSRTYAAGALLDEQTTDANGVLKFTGIPLGNFYVKEITSPAGYALDTSKHNITIKSGENKMTVTDVPDLRGKVEIVKTDSETGERLEGARFALYKWVESQTKYVAISYFTYDSERSCYVSAGFQFDASNLGKFAVRETENPEGYTGSFKEYFSLEGLEIGKENIITFNVTNEKVTHPHIEIRKIDGKSGELLPGAEFTVFSWNKEKNGYEDVCGTLTYAEADEIYRSEDLVATEENEGRFLVKETQNPQGYLGDWEQEILLTGDQLLYQFTVENEKAAKNSGVIKIRKTAKGTDRILPDAEFQVFAWDEELKDFGTEAVDTLAFQADENCYISASLIASEKNQGRFKVVETKNPDGYVGDWEQEILVEKENQEFTFHVENRPMTGKLVIVKKIKEADINWANGNPVFLFTAEGTDRDGISRKYETVVTYYPDSYETDGSGYAALSAVIPNVPLGTYKITEKPVMRYYLSNVYGNTSNVTVQQYGEPGYGKNPADVAAALAVLSSGAPEASVTMVNEKSRFDGYSHTSQVKNTVPFLFPEKADPENP